MLARYAWNSCRGGVLDSRKQVETALTPVYLTQPKRKDLLNFDQWAFHTRVPLLRILTAKTAHPSSKTRKDFKLQESLLVQVSFPH